MRQTCSAETGREALCDVHDVQTLVLAILLQGVMHVLMRLDLRCNLQICGTASHLVLLYMASPLIIQMLDPIVTWQTALQRWRTRQAWTRSTLATGSWPGPPCCGLLSLPAPTAS